MTVTHDNAQTYDFQAETKQLLDIVIHSLYSNKEIFLRELISNASDALDRLRFEALTQPELLGEGEELRIRLETDPDQRILEVVDNGIGMSRDEVIENLGTLAKSGSRELMDKLRQGPSSEATAELIGQFGVGFYSSFMVADRVEVVTRRAGEDTAVHWESAGDGHFTVEEAEREEHGTTVRLHLKPTDGDAGLDDFAAFLILKNVVKKYSDFVAYPILAQQTREEPELDEEGEPIEGKTRTVIEDQVLNSRQPIWTRPSSEVEDSEYDEFYKHISHDWNDPLDKLVLRAEGRLEYRALIYFPSKLPFDIYYRDQKVGLRLYVRRVLIMNHCEKLLPSYLRFLKGVVDSSDLPLNVSRELLQQDRILNQMRKWLVRKVLEHLKEMRDDDFEKYSKFWSQFGQVIKEGVSSEFDNKDRLLELVLFRTSHEEESYTTLASYVERMKDGQEEIYYAVGDNRARIESSPHLEAFKAKGYEVLYLLDPVDEMFAQSLTEYEGKRFRSISKGEVDLGTEEEKKEAEEKLEEKKEDYKKLLSKLQTKLKDHVKEVRLTRRLTTSPACLVSGEFDMNPYLERMVVQNEQLGVEPQKRILELNPEHEILGRLKTAYEEDNKTPVLDDYAQLLYGYALLAEGSPLPEPANFNQLLVKLMEEGLGRG